MARDLILDRLFHHVETQAGRPALWHFHEDQWRAVSWASYGAKVRAFAGALLAMDFAPGETVAITGDNCPEWVIAAIGAMAVRGVATGIYQTSTPEQLAYVAEHSEARLLVLEDKEQWEKIEQLRSEDPEALSTVERFVLIRQAETIDDAQVCSFEEFLATGASEQEAFAERFEALRGDDLAVLIYTSGTTGPPKGVMLDQRNLAFTSTISIEANGDDMTPEDCIVSYLPLSHIAEQMFSIHIAISAGYPIWFAASLDQVRDALQAARPTVFLAVPRVWEKFKAALENRLAEQQGPRAKIVEWARSVGLRGGQALLEQEQLSGSLALQYRLADRLFFSKLKAGLGLDRLRVAVSGAAPIGADVLEFFLSCGITIREVYGQSEGTGPTTYNQPRAGKTRLGTVGLPMPQVEVRLADDGEILVKGDNVFRGYFKNPEATAEALVDGWLHSGDIGSFDDEGFLTITDRKKDLIITAGGKNVAPQNIEKLLRKIDGVSQAVVIGDRRKFLSALLTLDPERAPSLASEKGWPTDPDQLAEHDAFVRYVQSGVDEANSTLARYETIKRFVLLPQDFSLETGELTPTQKIKRRVINSTYREAIESLYADVQ